MFKILRKNLTGKFFVLNYSMQQKNIEIYTYVSKSSIGKIVSPLDRLKEKRDD